MGTAPTLEYDVVVIGAGPTGENVADRVVQGGLTAAVIEAELVGGECSYWACMPTKALLRSGAVARAAARVPGLPPDLLASLDVGAVLARRDRFASHWQDAGQVAWLDQAGITLLRGRGRLTGRLSVEVRDGDTTTRVTARHAVVLATGSTALVPPIPGLHDVHPWTSREAAAASEVPSRLGIVGGGVVATEMATAFSGFGSSVTILARDGILPRSESFASDLVTRSLVEAGVRVEVGAEVVAVRRAAGAAITLSTATGDEHEVDQVLVAAGRRPGTAGLGLASVGLTTGTWLATDETMRVLDPHGDVLEDGWLYAVGDVNGRAPVTHQGKYQARAAGDVIVARATGGATDGAPWGWHVATADSLALPQVVFTDPEVASVGLTAAEAESHGYRTRVVDHDLGAVAGAALHADGYVGRARIVVDEDRQVIFGATFVGPDVAELLHAATIAVVGEVPLKRLWHAVPAYPTVSEVWLRLLEGYGRPQAHENTTTITP